MALVHAARQLCSSCPLWAKCLRDSVVRSDPGGYAAATTRQDRRWMRRRLGIGDSQGRLAAGPGPERQSIELDAVLDVFDDLQEHRARRPPHRAADATATRHDGARRIAPHSRQQVQTHEGSAMAAPTGERITFSLDDPALAVQKAVLGPLAHGTLQTLLVTSHLAGMLAHTPSGEVTPALLDSLRAMSDALDRWREAAQDTGLYQGTEGALTGSVRVGLAASDPVTALRQDIFGPLLHRLAEALERIEAITSLLLASPGGADSVGVPHGPELSTLRTAGRELAEQLVRCGALTPVDTDRGAPQETAREGRARAGAEKTVGETLAPARWSTPSLRKAVEAVVGTFPGPFTGRDVLAALPPGVYRDPGKSVSNVLSALAAAGRLRRTSRGTYRAIPPSAGPVAASS